MISLAYIGADAPNLLILVVAVAAGCAGGTTSAPSAKRLQSVASVDASPATPHERYVRLGEANGKTYEVDTTTSTMARDSTVIVDVATVWPLGKPLHSNGHTIARVVATVLILCPAHFSTILGLHAYGIDGSLVLAHSPKESAEVPTWIRTSWQETRACDVIESRR